jgi:hypothetical protein
VPSRRSFDLVKLSLSLADEAVTRCADPALDELRRVIPAAAALPLLLALAREGRPGRVVLGYLAGSHLQIDLA